MAVSKIFWPSIMHLVPRSISRSSDYCKSLCALVRRSTLSCGRCDTMPLRLRIFHHARLLLLSATTILGRTLRSKRSIDTVDWLSRSCCKLCRVLVVNASSTAIPGDFGRVRHWLRLEHSTACTFEG
jgi:hypothetical protein